MKRALLLLLAATIALTSCETAHNAAVATFRVIDAPHVYIRRQLGMDEEPQNTTTTSTTTETNVPPNGAVPPQPYAGPSSPPQPQRRVVANERSQEVEPAARPTDSPHIAATSSRFQSRAIEPRVSPTPRVASSAKSETPYAKPVPGKPGYVFSPFDKDGGYVDVTGIAPGTKVKDPYSGQIFLVP